MWCYCVKPGCGVLYVADGNWKLKYPHCMWKVPIEVEGFQNLINYPSICPHSPVRGQAFCTLHCEMAKSVAIPHGIHDFLKYCGLSGTPSFFFYCFWCVKSNMFFNLTFMFLFWIDIKGEQHAVLFLLLWGTVSLAQL